VRDEIVAELYGRNSTFFSLSELERGLVRKEAVQRHLQEEPAWLVRWENSLADLPEEERKHARPFASNLLSSRMAMIWQSAMAQVKKTLLQEKEGCGKKRGRNEDGVKKCGECQCELICPHCDSEQPRKKTPVYPR